jgi:hypothetical protein
MRLLSEAYGWRVLTDDADFGELDADGVRIMLSREAMVPWGVTDGIILHHSVEDVAEAAGVAEKAGAELLDGPLRTDWERKQRTCGAPATSSSVFFVTSDSLKPQITVHTQPEGSALAELVWPLYREAFGGFPDMQSFQSELFDRHAAREGFRLVAASVTGEVVGSSWVTSVIGGSSGRIL